MDKVLEEWYKINELFKGMKFTFDDRLPASFEGKTFIHELAKDYERQLQQKSRPDEVKR